MTHEKRHDNPRTLPFPLVSIAFWPYTAPSYKEHETKEMMRGIIIELHTGLTRAGYPAK